MILKKSQNRKQYGTIGTLILNCVKLLDQDRHPQVMDWTLTYSTRPKVFVCFSNFHADLSLISRDICKNIYIYIILSHSLPPSPSVSLRSHLSLSLGYGWSIPGRPEASVPVRDDPRVLAAPYEAAALLQGVQGLLRTVRRCH